MLTGPRCAGRSSASTDARSIRPATACIAAQCNPIGSTGKHATQVSSDGKGVSAATKNPAQAWRVLSNLFTGQPHGIQRFANGLGSPGSRNDVWDSDEFRATAPLLQPIAKVLVLPPAPEMAPWNYPANGRYVEHEPILLNEFVKVSLGQQTVEQPCHRAKPLRTAAKRGACVSAE